MHFFNNLERILEKKFKKLFQNKVKDSEMKELSESLLTKIFEKIKQKKIELKNSFNKNPNKKTVMDENTKEIVPFSVENIETSFRDQLIKTLQKELFKECSKVAKCPVCRYPRATIRKEGNLTFYVCRVIPDNQNANLLSGSLKKIEEEKSSEFKRKTSNSEIIKGSKKTQILNPIEVKEHLQNFYTHNQKLLDQAYGMILLTSSSRNKTGRTIKEAFSIEKFFMEIVSVTPNRFRPDNKLGDQIFLHSHTTLYTKILAINEDIKKIISKKDNQKVASVEEFVQNTNGNKFFLILDLDFGSLVILIILF